MSEDHELLDGETEALDNEEETLEERMLALVAQHAKERGNLAELISQLQKENNDLKLRLVQLTKVSRHDINSFNTNSEQLTTDTGENDSPFYFGDINKQQG